MTKMMSQISSCDITPIFFSVRADTKLEISLPPPTPLALLLYRKLVALHSVKTEICVIYAEAAVQRCSS